MPATDDLLANVRGWVEKAENDLKTLTWTLELQQDCPTDTVCFHAQQTVEKYIKALLTLGGIDFPKIHDVGELVQLLPGSQRPKLAPEEARRLTTYATTLRYPGEDEPVSLAEARGALKLARRIRKHVRAHLPREAVRRRRNSSPSTPSR